MAEEEEEALDMVEGEFLVQAVKGMGYGVGKVLGGEIILEVVDALAEAMDVAVLLLVEPPDQEMNLTMILREPCGDLLGEKDAGKIGDLEAPLDAVVIGDGDEIHAALAQQGVKLARIGIAVRDIKPAQEPLGGTSAEAGVDVEVNLRGHGKRLMIAELNRSA